MLKQTVENSLSETKALARFDDKLEIKFPAEVKQCNFCMQKLYIYKTHRRTVFTLKYGLLIACEILRDR